MEADYKERITRLEDVLERCQAEHIDLVAEIQRLRYKNADLESRNRLQEAIIVKLKTQHEPESLY